MMASVRDTIAGTLARRGALAAVGLGWVAAVATAVALRADLTVVLLVALLGLQVVSIVHSHRQNRFVVADSHRQVDALRRRIDDGAGPGHVDAEQLSSRLAVLTAKLDEASVAIARGPENTRRLVVRDTTTAYRQLEALFNLYSMVPVGAGVPPMRGWVASPDLLVLLVETVRANRPRLAVECGSGASTLWCALARRTFGVEGRHIALEHDRLYAQRTRELLVAHGVADYAEVRLVPLEPFHLGEREWSWYGKDAWQDLDEIDLLFVDGPPGVTAEHARYPALPLLADRIASGATVVVDDLIRTDEQELVARWLAEYPWLSETRLKVEKVASVLRSSPGST